MAINSGILKASNITAAAQVLIMGKPQTKENCMISLIELRN